MRLIVFAVLAAVLLATSPPARAESFPPITNKAVLTECGECHMAFFAEMLPRRSWLNILSNLDDHFGEDASIDPESLSKIIRHHITNASDVINSRGARKWREGLKKQDAPKSITSAPRFVRKHDDSDFDKMWLRLKVRSKADCAACHKDAVQGLFDDD